MLAYLCSIDFNANDKLYLWSVDVATILFLTQVFQPRDIIFSLTKLCRCIFSSF